jgi:hypothetical protein
MMTTHQCSPHSDCTRNPIQQGIKRFAFTGSWDLDRLSAEPKARFGLEPVLTVQNVHVARELLNAGLYKILASACCNRLDESIRIAYRHLPVPYFHKDGRGKLVSCKAILFPCGRNQRSSAHKSKDGVSGYTLRLV